MIKKEHKDCFKNVSINLGLICLVYLYMLANFWWGNHDWGYLKDGASIQSGLFEARYSQHLFTILFLDGHILPVFAFLSGFICIIAQAILIEKYLKLPKNAWFFISLFIAFNPHIYALFYYVYLFFPFMAWGLFGILLLVFIEKRFSFFRFFVGVLGFILLLGSYPPNLAFVFVLFVTKRLFEYLYDNESIKDSIKHTSILGLEFLVSVAGYKGIFNYLIKAHLINTDMYNIKTKGVFEILNTLPSEVGQSFLQLFHQFSFMGWWYLLPLAVIVITAVVIAFLKSENKVYAVFCLGALFLASRFAFLLSYHPEFAVFRLMYWGRLGVYIFGLSLLFKEKEKITKNILFFMLLCVGCCFVATNLYIQKVQNLGFVAGRMYQKSLVETVEKHEAFDKKSQYISLNLGQPNFRKKFYEDKYNTGELVELNLVFEFDVANFLFWEDEKSPVIIGAGVSGRDILRVDRGGGDKWRDMRYWRDNPENMENIRYWLYTSARPYPHENSIYIDDKYLLLILESYDFYNYRELVAMGLDR